MPQPQDPKSPASVPKTGDSAGSPEETSLERLEQALAEETRTSASLREHLDDLRRKIDEIAFGFEKRLDDATARSTAAEKRLLDQQARLNALGQGREETMRALADARAALARTAAERDQLQKRLAQIEGMQTATLTLPEEPDEEPGIYVVPPSLEELMASLSTIEEGGHVEAVAGHLHLRAETPEDESESQIMLAAELVFPEEYGAGQADAAAAQSAERVSRVLVLVDSDQPIKYPLYKDVMTIGRSESADIQVRGDFVSRIHARVVATAAGVIVEDVDSKNGVHVNSQPTERQTLKHGDVIGLGKVRFTFIDTTAEP